MSAAAQPEPDPAVAAVLHAADPEPVQNTAEPPAEEGAPTWMVTFGDMMALLLTFFILLFSMSEIEVKKFQQAVNSLHEGFGTSTVDFGDSDSPAMTPSDTSTLLVHDPVEDQLDEIATALETFVAENGLEQNLLVDRAEEGVYLRINDAALFQPGLAEMETDNAWIIEKLSPIMTAIDVPVTIAGHTDNIPISSSKYESNWELSASRAAGIARTLVAMGHNADDVMVTAFGEHRPIDTNDTPEGRARNRRVELFYSRQNVTEARLVAVDPAG